MPATPTQIKDFLSALKQAAQLDLNVIPRQTNLDFLTRHGFTPKERKEVILALQVEDYCKGPEEDDKAGGPRDIWFFGVDYDGVQIYIKLQLVEEKTATRQVHLFSRGATSDEISVQGAINMEQKRFCPKCDKTQSVKTIQREETLTVRETPIKVVSALTRCSYCQETFATEAQEEESVRKAYDDYRRQKALLSPSEVRDVRLAYGLSQTGLSQWLGWGEVTIHRYESGSLQDAAHNETLMLLKDPRNAKKLLEKHRDNLDSGTAANLEKMISGLLDTGVAGLIGNDLATSLAMVEPSEYNGYRRFDIDRFENLVFYVLEKAGPSFKTAINKLLWYIDFAYFREQTRSITGSQYLRFPHGPIPKSYDFLFAGMAERGAVEIEEVTLTNYTGERYTAKAPANVDLFQGNELKLIDSVIATLKGRSAKQLSDMAHKENAYIVTKDRQPISYRHANDFHFKPVPIKAKKAAAI